MTEEQKVIERVVEWAGSRHRAYSWYRNQPIPAVGGQTAEALVNSGQASLVHDYLDHMAVGGYV